MDPDLHDLLAAWAGGDLDADRRAALLRRVAADDGFRRAFVAETQMLSMLKAVQSAEPRWPLLEDELGGGPPSASASLEDRVLRAIDAPPGRRSAVWPWALVVSALVVAMLVPRQAPPPGARPPAEPTSDAPASVGVVLKADGVRYEESAGQRPTEGGPLRPGPLRLRAGQLTINFVNGVVLSLQGPAELDVASADRVFCRRGKLRTRVPPGAEGFTVVAPGSAVVDLGTEFALNVAADGKAEVMVFEGRAAVSVLNAAGHTLSSEERQGRAALEIDPSAGRIRDVAAEPERFVPAAALVPPALVLDPSYPADVVAARPWGYWRFAAWAGGVVPNEVAGRPGLRTVGGVGLDGTAVFVAGRPGQYLLLDGAWAPPRATGYAVEVWALSQGFQHSSLVALSPADSDSDRHAALLEFTGRSRALLHEECAIRCLDRWPAGKNGGANAFSSAMYTPNHWHHLVAQLGPAGLELYVDGKLAGTAPPCPAPGTGPCRMVLGRMKDQPDADPRQIRSLVGRLGELAVYDHPLPPETIRRHAALRAAGAAPK
jgi:hypothetical protein